jgi:uncharacterized lipoprotein NlpE involved in copper resistance
MQKNKLLYFAMIILILTAAITACASTHNSKNSLNWEGLYTGVTPSASGTGIEVQLTLRADQTYTLIYNYIDKSGYTAGNSTFRWDKTGGVIILKDTDAPPYYKVAEDRLLQLDMQGRKITGNLADMYILKKVK